MHRKSFAKAADFLRKLDEQTCAKSCGKPVENWWITSGTLVEKRQPDTTGRTSVTYCKLE
jgi:hypothetical protein